MLTNCDAIVIFLIYGQFGAIWKPDSDTLFAKLTLTLEVTFCLPKPKNFKHPLHTIALSKGTIFAKKC